MSEMSIQVKPTAEKLLQNDEDQLYEELGIRSRAIAKDLTKSSSFEPDVVYDGNEMGVLNDLRDLGKRIFMRLERDMYSLFCGSSDVDVEDRKKLSQAFNLGSTEVAAVMSVMLVTYLGLAPAIAAVLAVLVVKRVFSPTCDEFCKFWGEKLPKTG